VISGSDDDNRRAVFADGILGRRRSGERGQQEKWYGD
jgi:hypothetical protein